MEGKAWIDELRMLGEVDCPCGLPHSYCQWQLMVGEIMWDYLVDRERRGDLRSVADILTAAGRRGVSPASLRASELAAFYDTRRRVEHLGHGIVRCVGDIAENRLKRNLGIPVQ